MPKVCTDCFEVYDFDVGLQLYSKYCPRYCCSGEVAEIDELMIPIIKTLNTKGYETLYCCSGHTYDQAPNTYIKFELNAKLPRKLPKGFKRESDKVIRRIYEPSDEVTMFIEILDSIKDLLIWANELKEVVNK
jgi:hypothetical protein